MGSSTACTAKLKKRLSISSLQQGSNPMKEI